MVKIVYIETYTTKDNRTGKKLHINNKLGFNESVEFEILSQVYDKEVTYIDKQGQQKTFTSYTMKVGYLKEEMYAQLTYILSERLKQYQVGQVVCVTRGQDKDGKTDLSVRLINSTVNQSQANTVNPGVQNSYAVNLNQPQNTVNQPVLQPQSTTSGSVPPQVTSTQTNSGTQQLNLGTQQPQGNSIVINAGIQVITEIKQLTPDQKQQYIFPHVNNKEWFRGFLLKQPQFKDLVLGNLELDTLYMNFAKEFA